MKLRAGAVVAVVVFAVAWLLLLHHPYATPDVGPAAGSVQPSSPAAPAPHSASPGSSAGTAASPTDSSSAAPASSSTSTIPALDRTASAAGPSGSPVDRHDATAVAAMFTAALETWDTVHDHSPADAARRAGRYANPTLARQLDQQPPAPLQAWTALAARHATTSVVTVAGGLGPTPADTHTDAVRAISAAITNTSPDGTHTDGVSCVCVVHLHRDRPGRPWTVSSYQISH